MSDMRLPKFRFEGDDRYQFSWPPPQPSLAAQIVQAGGFAVPLGGVFGPDWHEKLVERDRQIVAEVKRAEAEAEARQREREKRELEEIRKAK